MSNPQPAVVTTEGLQALIEALGRRGYRVVGPTVRDQAIIYDDIVGRSRTCRQAGPTSRMAGPTGSRRDDDALFGYAVGPHSWKKFLHPPRCSLWQAPNAATTASQVDSEPTQPTPPFAFIGVRSCELHAIAIQDRVFLGGPHVDPHYEARREGAFIVAVNCGAGRRHLFLRLDGHRAEGAKSGFDLALTELLDDDGHRVPGRGRAASRRRGARPTLPRRAADARRAGGRRRGRGADRSADGPADADGRHP